MTYAESIRFLYDLQLFGSKLGLENTRRLQLLAGQPETGLRFIHVAGTNGKGSVCRLLASIYQAAGMKVGLFTSPHLVRFNERIQVGGRRMTDEDLVRGVEQVREWLRRGVAAALFPLLASFMA